MSTDREVLAELLGAVERALDDPEVRPEDDELFHVRARVRAHLARKPEHDCSAEVERASRAAYAAGRNSGANP